MIQELADESDNQVLEMNKSKTKVMMETDIQIENVESYIYMGQRYSTKDKNQDNEIHRRITAGWTAFVKHRDIFKGNIGTCLKRQIYNSCILQAKLFGAETWVLTMHPYKEQASSRGSQVILICFGTMSLAASRIYLPPLVFKGL